MEISAPLSARPINHRSAPPVVVLVPEAEQLDPALAYYSDYSQSRDELAKAFATLGRRWEWTPVTVSNFAQQLQSLADPTTGSGDEQPTILNLCDGDDSGVTPGVDVIAVLDQLGFRYTGANQPFYRVTTSKIPMKAAFDSAGVATAPWHVWNGTDDAASVLRAVGTPAIVKPAMSAGSLGVSTASVVDSAVALREQISALDAGYLGWNLSCAGVLVERFIAGREFTVLIVGNSASPTTATIYPPVERVFNASLPPTEQFLSYDRLWEVYEREAPLPNGAYLWEYAPLTGDLAARVEQLSWDAYAAVNGHGYGRIDLRYDNTADALYVLEVNAQCGLSDDENYTSVGAILRYANATYATLIGQILALAESRP